MARRVEGLMKQRLRIAELPRAAKAEAGRFFGEANALGLRRHEGRTWTTGGARGMRLVFVGPGHRYEAALLVASGGGHPSLSLKRGTFGATRSVNNIAYDTHPSSAVIRNETTSTRGEDGMWTTSRAPRQALDARTGAELTSAP
jgi:hypothetical protein